MATVNYQLEQVSQNNVIVTWANLANGDTGEKFPAVGYSIGAWEITGTSGSGLAGKVWQAYSVLNPVYTSSVSFTSSNVPGRVTGENGGANSGSLYPEVTTGDETTDITITMVLVPQLVG